VELSLPVHSEWLYYQLGIEGLVPDVLAEVNEKVAPVTITGGDLGHREQNALEFYGRWGTLTFTFYVPIGDLIYQTADERKKILVRWVLNEAHGATEEAVARIAREAEKVEHGILRGRVDALEQRVTAIEEAWNDREEAESEARRGADRPHWIRRIRDAWNRVAG
jgi:hypothetical protein